MKVQEITRGAALESIVLGNSKKLFLHGQKISAWDSNYISVQEESGEGRSYWKKAAGAVVKRDENESSDSPAFKESQNCCESQICWWNPPSPCQAADFCLDSSMHGLKFVAQPKRHLTERIFWIIMFLSGLATAIVLINSVWDRYYKNPVIVSFNPTEIDIDNIPFPAVTVCNMNKFPKSLVNQIKRRAFGNNPDPDDAEDAKDELQYINSACTLKDSFAKQLNFAYSRGVMGNEIGNESLSYEGAADHLLHFLLTKSLPCELMIRHCIWAEKPVSCKAIFKTIVTDYGFNLLPLPLLLKVKTVGTSPKSKGANDGFTGWTEEEITEWAKWKYDEGATTNKTLKYPRRQKRAGMPYGLSFLVDPNTKDYFCPASDSDGVRFMLHSHLEIPHIDEFGSAIGMNNEVFIEMQPDVTLANPEIKDFDSATRKCVFSYEKELEFYKPYSVSTCIDSCESEILVKKCNCTYYYMPRRNDTDVCNTNPSSSHRKCIQNAKLERMDTLEKACGHCEALCEDIAYNFEVTTSVLQHPDITWGSTANKTKPSWANNDISVVHIFFGVDITVPKIRQKMYTITDLIANTGSLLGLCLGFSALSLVEVIYFVTLRLFWQTHRRKTVGKSIANKFMTTFGGSNNEAKKTSQKKKSKTVNSWFGNKNKDREDSSKDLVIQLDRQLLPLYPAYSYENTNSNHHNQIERSRPNHFSYSHLNGQGRSWNTPQIIPYRNPNYGGTVNVYNY